MATPPPVGPWSPLQQPTFRALWLAILVGNIGTWIHDVAAAWVMAETTGSPLMVAAVQSATTLPVVLLAIVAGTLADIIDRRRYLIIAQLWMLLVASTLAVLAHLDMLRPWTLVALTFALGIGAAMAMPAQQATTPELVPRPMLGPAVALGSLSMNIARSIGPALGGLIVAQAGIAWAFAVNALSFLGVVVVLWRWRRTPASSALPPETFGMALRAGLRYARQASVLQSVLVKAACFFVFASALTALLPIVVKQELGASAGTYGLLLGCIGIGAIAGAMLLPALRTRFHPDAMVLAATGVYAGCMVALALLRNIPALYVVSLFNGFAWITVLSSLQIAAQTSVPAWVRARALSLYIVVFSADMAVGSLGWGAIAQAYGTPMALIAAAIGTVIAALASWRFRLGEAARVNVTPSGHWPQPVVASDVGGDRGPVLVTVEYRVNPARREEFLTRMQPLGHARRRNGAVQWGVAEDSTQPGTYLEYFVDCSWHEHLRQHERVTEDERALQDAIKALLEDPTHAPVVRHFIGGAPGNPVPVPSQAPGGMA
ncbi:putative MFS family arabinose efflux permease [Pseudoxanthomonas sp. 3HH-4]|uniref:MFS transporter n=1 Tax=Pseudoxanthomonas sp. 3HH-4 TaxID=1690214 RepID=UPI0011508F3D|nr:MFS transporter [Pseudoxanthomonas sp. 3HH-4]TQM12820.1 putative MFS family arabinose efflux permease [Pseudoxanthomonas sp. 3HH-4]